MLQSAWLIGHLLVSAMSSMPAAAAAQAGLTCTYQACVAKCTRLNGPVCNSYCDAKIPQRLAGGVCAASDDPAPGQNDHD